MKTYLLKSSSFALLTACVFVCAASPHPRAQSAQNTLHAYAKRCGFTRDLVYLNTPSGSVDVTASLYTSQGQTYAVLNNAPIAIVVDTTGRSVCSLSGRVIGYTVPVTDTVPVTN